MIRSRLLTAALGLIALAACERNTPTATSAEAPAAAGQARGESAPAAPKSPCELVTTEELQRIFARTFAQGVAKPVEGGQRCEWTLTSAGEGFIALSVIDGTAAVEQRKTAPGAEPIKEIKGGAAWVPEKKEYAFAANGKSVVFEFGSPGAYKSWGEQFGKLVQTRVQ